MAHAAVGARRYAEAAFQVAEADDALDQWQADLRMAAEILGMPEAARASSTARRCRSSSGSR